METSLLIAKILCIIYLTVGIGLVLNRSYYKNAFIELLENKAFLFLGGWIAIVAGVSLINYHNLWVNDWRVIITLIAWIALIKGILLFAFPKIMPLYKPLFLRPRVLDFITLLVVVLGLFFGYLGFF